MGMGVDASRQNQLAGGRDHPGIRVLQVGAKLDDFFAFDQDIGSKGLSRSDQRTTFNQSFHTLSSCHG